MSVLVCFVSISGEPAHLLSITHTVWSEVCDLCLMSTQPISCHTSLKIFTNKDGCTLAYAQREEGESNMLGLIKFTKDCCSPNSIKQVTAKVPSLLFIQMLNLIPNVLFLSHFFVWVISTAGTWRHGTRIEGHLGQCPGEKLLNLPRYGRFTT